MSKIQTEIDQVPVTKERPVADLSDSELESPGLARVNLAATVEHPHGSPQSPKNRTVLQQHVDFFDRNRDGIITPIETFIGFRAIGFNVFLCLVAVIVIHSAFSIATHPNPYFPFDPFFRIWCHSIHRGKHGSDTEVYDTEGRFVPQKFEEIFSKWDKDQKQALTFREMLKMTQDIRNVNDLFGWFASKFEWGSLYLLCADKSGLVPKEDIRGVYDGTLFYRLEHHQKKEE
ncbi:caleosin [Gorgonomyces haynaldii]|nr:caleosin [Gorgonomyces haynaldii]